MTIKEQLLSGKTPKEILDELNKELTNAQREIDSEKKQATEIENAEQQIVDAIHNYYNVLGIEVEDDLDAKIHNTFKLARKLRTNFPEIKIDKKVNGKSVLPTEDEVDRILKKYKNLFY